MTGDEEDGGMKEAWCEVVGSLSGTLALVPLVPGDTNG
jgi:hypothetical protein